MASSTAERYFELFRDDRQALLALVACSAALQLDDKTACEVIELIAQSNGSTQALMHRVKKLGCVWKDWNGFWHVSEDVRRVLLDWLYRELPETTIIKLRERLAQKADSRAAQIKSDDQVAAHQKLLAGMEGAYHRILIPETRDEGANELLQLWRQLPPSAAEAMARSVDYLADELAQRVRRLPDAILFLRGIAARDRDDDHAQEKYFVRVWRRGRHGQPGYVHAMAAHFLALLLQYRDPKTAEQALSDSIKWMDQSTQVAETWMNDLALAIDEFQPPIHDEMYQFALDYLRHRGRGQSIDTAAFLNELYARFFKQPEIEWESRAQFFGHAAHLLRRVLVDHARTQYTTKLSADRYSQWVNNVDEFGTQPEADLLTLDEALNRLQKIDPNQVRIVELLFYAGLTVEKTAEVMQVTKAAVAREWRLAKAFLKRELTREKGVIKAINFPNLMSSTATLSVELR